MPDGFNTGFLLLLATFVLVLLIALGVLPT
mgnify:CR=1 FL=1